MTTLTVSHLGALVTAAFLMPPLSIHAMKSNKPGSGPNMDAATGKKQSQVSPSAVDECYIMQRARQRAMDAAAIAAQLEVEQVGRMPKKSHPSLRSIPARSDSFTTGWNNHML